MSTSTADARRPAGCISQPELGSRVRVGASALLLPRRDLTVATWDRRLHQAVAAHDVALLPEQLP